MKNKRRELGLEKTEEFWGEKRTDLIDQLDDLGELIIDVAFGEVYQSKALTSQEREFITLGILISKGDCEDQLRNHLKAALNLGLTQENIKGLIIHSALYTGFPNAINVYKLFNEVLEQS